LCTNISVSTDAGPRAGADRSCMSGYAVVRRDTAEPNSTYAGSLSIEEDRVLLRGNAGRVPVVCELPREEISAVRRVRGEEGIGIGGFPSLRLDLNSGRSFLLSSVMGLGVLFDVLDALASGG
jgi:hypothetical protein